MITDRMLFGGEAEMKVGDIEVAVLRDGSTITPGHFFGPLDGHHGGDVAADGTITLPIAAFLLRLGGKNVLIDAGMGPRDLTWAAPSGDNLRLYGGALPGALASEGLRPEEIDYVFPTHLHGEHAGWLFPDGAQYFPNAIIGFGAGDWLPWVENSLEPTFMAGMLEAAEAGRVQLIERDSALLPGLNTMHTPGHTPGHQCFVLSSGTARAIILGDAISCPLQMENAELEAVADVDRQAGIATREAILRELEGSDVPVGGPHFPGLRFGRVMAAEGRRYWS
jgi:glyoxylase-like metal-dependent hydrolase (beta-lactamase superfamily II)